VPHLHDDPDLKSVKLTALFRPGEAERVERTARRMDRSVSWFLRACAMAELDARDQAAQPRRAAA
jgi:hypothetical protein